MHTAHAENNIGSRLEKFEGIPESYIAIFAEGEVEFTSAIVEGGTLLFFRSTSPRNCASNQCMTLTYFQKKDGTNEGITLIMTSSISPYTRIFYPNDIQKLDRCFLLIAKYCIQQ